MAVGKPDEFQHNNEDRAFVDSRFVRGGARQVADRAALYALAGKADQLQENVTVVRILGDDDHGGAKTKVLLVDLAQVGTAAGWELEAAAGAPAPGGSGQVATEHFTATAAYDLVHNLGYPPAAQVYDAEGDLLSVPTHEVDANTLRFFLQPPTAGKIIYYKTISSD